MDDMLLNQIKTIVFKHISPSEAKVFIFGSRAVNKNRKYSDIDLGIQPKDELSVMTKVNLEEGFDDSNIPYKVDVVDFSKVGETFTKVAMQNVIYLN